jgi:hypothetical protein
MAGKGEGPGTAAAATEARKVDALGRRIDLQTKSSPVLFQALAAVYDGLEPASLGGEQ